MEEVRTRKGESRVEMKERGMCKSVRNKSEHSTTAGENQKT